MSFLAQGVSELERYPIRSNQYRFLKSQKITDRKERKIKMSNIMKKQ